VPVSSSTTSTRGEGIPRRLDPEGGSRTASRFGAAGEPHEQTRRTRKGVRYLAEGFGVGKGRGAKGPHFPPELTG